MFLTLSQELLKFLTAQMIAVICAVTFDLFRSLKTGSKPGSVFDLIICFALGTEFWLFWQKYLCGEFRWYTVLGFIITLVLYFSLLSRTVVLTLTFFVRKIYDFFHIIYKFLLTVLDFLGKIIMHTVEGFKKKYTVDSEGKNNEKT